ncbi:serine/threonine protein phosphatase family protein [Streptococcus pneumoniae]|nr:serine/threonine protein phosphatase family protein [Streptococcus pneumoniae]
MTKIALLSDIHGNTTALEAVLADARQLGVDEYWLLGDILMPGTGRRRILDLLDQLPITARVLGNWLRLEFWETGKTVFGMVSVRNWIVLALVNAISCASASMF